MGTLTALYHTRSRCNKILCTSAAFARIPRRASIKDVGQRGRYAGTRSVSNDHISQAITKRHIHVEGRAKGEAEKPAGGSPGGEVSPAFIIGAIKSR